MRGTEQRDLREDIEAQDLLAQAEVSPTWQALMRILTNRLERARRDLEDNIGETYRDHFLKGGIRIIRDILNLPEEARRWLAAREVKGRDDGEAAFGPSVDIDWDVLNQQGGDR